MRAHPFLLLGCILVVGAALRAQQGDAAGDAERRLRFLRAREEMRTVPVTPSPATTPAPRPKPKPIPEPKPVQPPEPIPKPEPETTPRVTPPKPSPQPEITPRPKPKPRPRPTPLLVITPKPSSSEPPVPVNIVKESPGPQEIVPAEVEHRGWFAGGPKYNYLTRSIRQEIDRAPVVRNRWRYTVVHNSGTRQGSAKAFEHYHRNVRKMQNGLAYHFVIGNGTSTGDGAIEIGDRWRRQINGGHVHSDYLNNIALGICLVGDYNRDVPTKRQLEALDELIRYLRKRVGNVDGKQSIVKAHREINPPRWPTDCPGDRFPYRWLHGKFD